MIIVHMKIKIKRFDRDVPLPQYDKDAAGLDLFSRSEITIEPGEIKGIPSNVAMEIPKNHVLLVVSRSTIPTRRGLVMPHSVGVIDPFFCGDDNEIILIFKNTTNKTVIVEKGAKLAQGILVKFERIELEEVQKLENSGAVNVSYDRK